MFGHKKQVAEHDGRYAMDKIVTRVSDFHFFRFCPFWISSAERNVFFPLILFIHSILGSSG